jgi:hypothetical protein
MLRAAVGRNQMDVPRRGAEALKRAVACHLQNAPAESPRHQGVSAAPEGRSNRAWGREQRRPRWMAPTGGRPEVCGNRWPSDMQGFPQTFGLHRIGLAPVPGALPQAVFPWAFSPAKPPFSGRPTHGSLRRCPRLCCPGPKGQPEATKQLREARPRVCRDRQTSWRPPS